TCLETTKDYHTIALYSHLVPLFVTVVVSSFVLVKSKFSMLSKVFTLFTFGFCLWLLGDVIIWTSSNYNLVSFLWSPLDYINVLFYLFGAYFLVVLVTGKDISFWGKLLLFVLFLPAWWITVTNQSISVFDQTVCEAINSDFLTNYKFYIEILVIAFIGFYALFSQRKCENAKKWQIAAVSLALILFFSVFAATEYISSETGIYEINLYSLFVLPVFLFMIVYSISNLEIFRIRLVGFQLLPYVLIVMVGSQFFFLENPTDRALTTITFIASLGFGLLLLRSGKKEVEAREKIEKLATELEQVNIQLKELDRQKDELISIVSHQLATPVTSVKWYIEMMLDGDTGKLTAEQQKQLTTMQGVTGDLADLVGMILDVSRLQLGKMKVDRTDLDLSTFFRDILAIIEPKAAEKKVKFLKSLPKELPTAMLDKRLMRMTLENLLTNAVKYTPAGGEAELKVWVEGKKLHYTVRDTGCGIPKSEQPRMFEKLYRATNVRTVDGNGFGLFVAKGAVEAQGGSIRFESAEGKGTTFYVEIPVIKKGEMPQVKGA
ncbi:MAG: HAMP domain-containing sensor histidine kinase, partial [Candidatus Paceibacterota bacterium]